MTRPARSLLLAALAAVLPLSMEAAEADKPRELLQPPKQAVASPITDRFALRGTYSQPRVDTPFRYDPSPLLRGTDISGEDTLGFDDELNQGSLEMMFRMTDRHRIRADFYTMSRSGDVLLDQLVQFGDDTYRVNDRVESDMDLRMLGITYAYSVLRRETVEIGLGLGIHLMQIEGEASVPARLLREDFDVAGPFATLAVDGTWRFTKRFSANARAQYLSGNIDDIDGSFLNYHGDVQFRWRPNLAFGVGYSHWGLRVDSLDEEFSGRVVLKVRGPEAFVRVSF